MVPDTLNRADQAAQHQHAPAVRRQGRPRRQLRFQALKGALGSSQLAQEGRVPQRSLRLHSFAAEWVEGWWLAGLEAVYISPPGG